MFRWLIVTLLALVLIQALVPALKKWGFGKLPGDFNLRFRGKQLAIPLGSTIVLSLLAGLLAKLI